MATRRNEVTAYLAKIGKVGGSKTSTAKADASRANGKRGGRPKRNPYAEGVDAAASKKAIDAWYETHLAECQDCRAVVAASRENGKKGGMPPKAHVHSVRSAPRKRKKR